MSPITEDHVLWIMKGLKERERAHAGKLRSVMPVRGDGATTRIRGLTANEPRGPVDRVDHPARATVLEDLGGIRRVQNMKRTLKGRFLFAVVGSSS